MVAEEERTVSDAVSFSDFYASSYASVVRALALTLGDAELTADAAQEAFARALARWAQVSDYDNPAGWVYRVGLNWARSRWRRRARELLTGKIPESDPVELPAPSDPEVALAMRGLPVEQRAVVVLRLYLDWSVDEVAAALDVSPGTVKSRLSRALARLQERLEVSS